MGHRSRHLQLALILLVKTKKLQSTQLMFIVLELTQLVEVLMMDMQRMFTSQMAMLTQLQRLDLQHPLVNGCQMKHLQSRMVPMVFF